MTPSLRAAAIMSRHTALPDTIARLRRHQPISVERYLADEFLPWFIERGLERAASCVLDMGAHVLAILGQPVPDDYTAVIDALATAGVLTTEFARSFRAMAGFRNVLVHEYLSIPRSSWASTSTTSKPSTLRRPGPQGAARPRPPQGVAAGPATAFGHARRWRASTRRMPRPYERRSRRSPPRGWRAGMRWGRPR